LLSRRHFALLIGMLASAGLAGAAQAPEPVILVQYVVSDNSAGRVQDTLTSPLERTLSALPRVVNMTAVTGIRAKGVTVDLEVQFEGGASGQDLMAVLGQIAQLEINKDIGPTSVSVHLGAPRIDKDTDLLLR
jgi:hypothetical protein